jgi:Tol biopolymer transport system component
VISVDEGLPRRLTTNPAEDVVPSWSKDGRWIYFASNRTGQWQVWKVPVAGGPEAPVTKNGGFAAFESPDGQFVHYAKFDTPGIWKVPVAGGEESLILDALQPGLWGYWAVVDQGVYFVNLKATPPSTIEFFNFATRRVTPVVTFETGPSWWSPGLAVSPDGRWLLYTQVEKGNSDIMVVENFR